MNLWQDLQFALRALGRERGFAVVTASTLAVGIGLNATVFTLVNAVLIRDLPFARPDRVVYVGTHDLSSNRDRGVSYAEFKDLRESAARSLPVMAAYSEQTMNVSDAVGAPERFAGSYVSAAGFRLVGVTPVLGRDFQEQDDRPGVAATVILSHDLWTGRFNGDPGIIGAIIRVNGVPSTVIGVMPREFRFPLVADLWQPLSLMPGLLTQARDARLFGVVARLADTVGLTQAQADVARVTDRLAKEFPDTSSNIRPRVIPFRDRYIAPQLRLIFLGLLGAVGFVLLIACANIANLMLARASRRFREVAIRTAIGATRWKVIRQVLLESVLMSAMGGAAGLWLAALGVRGFAVAVENTGRPYWIEFTIDWTVFAYFTVVCVATGIIFGLAPALQISRANANDILKEGGRAGSAGHRASRWTSGLVVAELALTLVLLSGAGLMMNSFVALYRLDLGIDTSEILSARLELPSQTYSSAEGRLAFFERLRERLAAAPVLVTSTMATAPPAGGGEVQDLLIGDAERPDEPPPTISTVAVGDEYFDAMQLPIVRGRPLTAVDGTAGHPNIVINQRLAAVHFPDQDAIGRRVRLRSENNRSAPASEYVIVGVSATVRQRDFDEPQPDPVAYIPFRAAPPTSISLLVRTRNASEVAVPALRAAVASLDSNLPLFEVTTLDESLAQRRWPYRVFGGMFVVFALFALALSMVGLYAVTAYSVALRRQEIGLRMALGAEFQQVWWLIVRRAAIQLSLGIALGTAGAFAVGELLRSVLIGASGGGLPIIAGLIALMTIVAGAAILVPAARVALVHPSTALAID